MLEQGTPEWLAAKAGVFSASRASALMASGRGGAPSATRANLIADLAAERMTGRYTEGFKNAAMERGNELEAEARDAYSFEKGVAVEQVAFVKHPTIVNCGCSPDGLVGDDGLVEIKCPSARARHVAALLNGAHAVEYRLQVQFQMMVTGRKWCDVVSYDPAWEPDLQLAITRVQRDEKVIGEIVGALAIAEREVNELINQLKAIQEGAKS